MPTLELNVQGFYEEVADRFGALSEVFGHLTSPADVQGLFEGLTSEEGAGLNWLADQINLPMLGKCWWLQGIIEKVVSTPTGFAPDQCWLKENLTAAQRRLYLEICLRHRPRAAEEATESHELILEGGHRLIPPGLFLDDLRKNDLVDCDRGEQTYDSRLTPILGLPERVCI
jgi:hypothetical protein